MLTPIAFGTKAETLDLLEGRLRSARVPPQVRFTLAEWRTKPEALLARVAETPWGDGILIARSSALGEDGAGHSLAGHYLSVANVVGKTTIISAIKAVADSLDGDEDQIFIQPFLKNIVLAGVAFGRDPNTGAPYRVINYDLSGSTSSVTGGASSHAETFVWCQGALVRPSGPLGDVLALLDELESLFGTDWLDVEFAMDRKGILHLLQVRPLAKGNATSLPATFHRAAVSDIAAKIERAIRPHPYLLGRRTIYGIMPDWNPAEIIGIRPRPLALSLYRELVTDSIWAYQRDNYGYRNLRSFPLIVDFHGLPYIDVRVSFNSFIPQDLEQGLAERLADYYLDRLEADPAHHDKVEFEIIFSCFSLDLPERLERLADHGFDAEDRQRLMDSLRTLTNRIVDSEGGLWRQDLARIEELERRQAVLAASDLDPVARLYWLLEDCKRYGTLPFAGLARAGFIAVQTLRSMVAMGLLLEAEREAFMASLDTVGSRLERDFRTLGREDFLARYGHLRPGTYDILSPRYDEAPDIYFDWTAKAPPPAERPAFALPPRKLERIEALLREHGLVHDARSLMAFIKGAIEAREYSKFVFTRSLSDALALLGNLGAEYGFERDDCSYIDIGVVHELYTGSRKLVALLNESIQTGRRRHALARHLVLPPLILKPEDAWSFHLPRCEPNFITQRSVSAPTARDLADPRGVEGAIALIPSADPGFDWIFARGIAGFVTQYGGVNSHMAIRAGELGIPAVIGAGESRFTAWSKAAMLHLDCGNRQVTVVR